MESQKRQIREQQKPGLGSVENAAIQAIAHRVGLRVSEEIVSALSETISLIRELQKQPTTSSVAIAETDILTVAEVAKRLKISRTKAYQLIQRHQIRSISMDRTVRVRREDLEAFITEHERP